MVKVSKALKRILIILITLLIPPLIIFGVSGGVYAAAETEEKESSGIMRELSGLTIDGKKFNADNYPALGFGNPRVLYLNEVGYNYYANKQDNYQLTLYIYNPAQLALEEDVRNMVQLKAGNAARYDKYALKIMDASADKLFYKFSVDFTAAEKSAVLSNLDKESRKYIIISLEFYIEGYNATDFAIGRTYTFTGYGAGMDDKGSASPTLETTLSYTVTGGTTVIPLEVKHTSWRPEGTNGSGDNVQDTIHSVYFAVPNELNEQYDYLNSVKAQWIEAQTKEIFVTGNEELWKAMYDLNVSNALFGEGNTVPDKFDFTGFEWALGCYHLSTLNEISTYQYGYNLNGKKISTIDKPGFHTAVANKEIGAIYMPYYTGGKAAEDYIVTSSEVAELIRSNDFFYNDKKVAGKYPSYLFRQWDEDFHTEVITRGEKDKELNLHSEEVKRNFWQKIFGGSSIENVHDYENIEAIKEMTDSLVLNGDAKTVCNKLYIFERDYEDFKKFYNDNKADSTIYLLRFATSKYIADNVTIFKQSKIGGLNEQNGETAYLAQETCYLNFDIIDFEYKKNDESYVIPVSMSPIDIFPPLTPPPVEMKTGSNFWIYGVVIIAALIVVGVVYGQIEKVRR